MVTITLLDGGRVNDNTFIVKYLTGTFMVSYGTTRGDMLDFYSRPYNIM